MDGSANSLFALETMRELKPREKSGWQMKSKPLGVEKRENSKNRAIFLIRICVLAQSPQFLSKSYGRRRDVRC